MTLAFVKVPSRKTCSSSYGGTPCGFDANCGYPQLDAAIDSGDAHVSKQDAHHSDTGSVDAKAPTDAPCNFASFVIGLIDNDTTATAKPSLDLGASCTDDQKQSDFASLFP